MYIAEIIEEHSRLAKTIGKRLVYGIMAFRALLCIADRLPVYLTVLGQSYSSRFSDSAGIAAHYVYSLNLGGNWPYISLTSPTFLASCVLTLLDHFVSFFYFADRAKYAGRYGHRQPYRSSWDDNRSRSEEPLTFMDVATYFGFCVWLVPFFLFLSLSANDNVLPSLGRGESGSMSASVGPGGTPSINAPRVQVGPRTSILKTALEALLDLLPMRARGYRGSRSARDGLISPNHSRPPSPMLSPNNETGWPGAAQNYGWGPPPMSPTLQSPTVRRALDHSLT